MLTSRVCAAKTTGASVNSWLSRWGLSPGLARLLAMVAGGLILAVAAYVHGWRNAAARGQAELAAYQAQVANAQIEAARHYAAQVQAQAARADGAAVKLLAQQADIARLTKQLQERVNHVSTIYIPQPGAAPEPLPSYPFTRGWVHDYNAALGLRMPGTFDLAAEPAGASPGVRPAHRTGERSAELARSSVAQADVLTVHHANSQICREAIAQLNAILDLYEDKQP